MKADSEITEALRRFVACELLGEPDSMRELTDRAPLLEWGILDSLNTARLLAYLGEAFAVDVPMDDVVVDNFRDIAAIARLVGRLRDAGTAGVPGDGVPDRAATPGGGARA